MEERILFEELSHSYTSERNGKHIKWLSCTSFINKFIEQFDEHAEFWAAYKVIQDMLGINNDDAGRKEFSSLMRSKGLNFQNKDIKQLKKVTRGLVNWDSVLLKINSKLEEWNDKKNKANTLGTAFHEYKEEQSHKNKRVRIGDNYVDFAPTEKYVKDGKAHKYSESLEGIVGARLELLVYLPFVEIEGIMIETNLCGQLDKANFRHVTRRDKDNVIDTYVDIDDYKTYEKLSFENPNNKKFNYPINHIELTKFYTCALQMSLYAYMLEKKGYKVGNLYFSYHDIKAEGMIDELNDKVDSEKVKIINLPYLKEEIEQMILFYFTGKIKREKSNPFKVITSNRKSVFEL